MRFLLKLSLIVVAAVVAQMGTDVMRIALAYPMDFCSSRQVDAGQALAIRDVEQDFNRRCTATKWIVTKVIELPLDQTVTDRNARAAVATGE